MSIIRNLYFTQTKLDMFNLVDKHTGWAQEKSFRTSKKSKKKQPTAHTAVLTPDHTHLTCGHHQAMIASLALLPQLLAQSTHTPSTAASTSQSVTEGGACKSEAGGMGVRIDLLLIGLGGGALPMFINKCIHNVSYRGLCMCTYNHACVCVCVYTHTRARTHTHTHSLSLSLSLLELHSCFCCL